MLTQTWHKRLIALIVACTLLMEALDSTVINTAIPTMAHSLNINPIDLKIALISYLLSLAIFIPISGWVADKFGAKRVFLWAIVIFAVSSFWCGFAHNLLELTIARCLQGVGGSIMLPVGRLILLRTYARYEIISIMNIVVMVGALGTMLGPVFGGFIVEYVAWSWIFWINIPVAILVIIAAKHWLKPSTPQAVPPLDKSGFVLFGSSLALFTFGLSALSESVIPQAVAALIISCAVLLFGAYIWHSRHQPHPIVKTELLRQRTFQISISGNLLTRLGFGAVPFLIPLLLQLELGYSPQTSGLLLAPTALGVLLAKPLSLHTLRWLGYKRLLIANTFLVGLSLAGFALVNADTPLPIIALLTFSFGSLASLQYTGMNSLAYAEVSQENLSAATSVMSTLQQLAQSFGVATGAILIHYLAPGRPQGAVISVAVFHHTFLILGGITGLSMLVFLRLRADDGHQMLVRETKENVNA